MNKKISISLFGFALLLFHSNVIAQEVETAQDSVTKSTLPDAFLDPQLYFLAGVFLVMFITIIVLSRVLLRLVRAQLPESLTPEANEVPIEESTSLWTKFDRKFLTKAVPVEKEEDIMLDHGYDGIRELDNDLPPWWKYGFYLTIIWAFGYLVYYHVTDSGPLSIEEYNKEIADAGVLMKERMAKNAEMVTAETVVLLTEAEAINEGKSIYTANCQACHGQNAEGTVGPNLTDDNWLHGGGISNVFSTIQNGVPAKGMIAWKNQLSPKQIQQVSSFILSLQGTKPANAKEPQGEVWKESVTTANDSSEVKSDTAAVLTSMN